MSASTIGGAGGFVVGSGTGFAQMSAAQCWDQAANNAFANQCAEVLFGQWGLQNPEMAATIAVVGLAGAGFLLPYAISAGYEAYQKRGP
jgi:hypothetical protein